VKSDAARAAAARRAPAAASGLRGSPGAPPLVRKPRPACRAEPNNTKKTPTHRGGAGKGGFGDQTSRASAGTWGSSAAAGAATGGAAAAAATSGSSSSAGGGGT